MSDDAPGLPTPEQPSDRPFPDATDYGAAAACVLGAILVGVAMFLPSYASDATEIVDNTMIEEDGGWIFPIVVAALVATAGGYLRKGRPSGLGKVVAVVLMLNVGRTLVDDGARELYPVDMFGNMDTSAEPVIADPAAGVYLATAGAVLAVAAIRVMRSRQLPEPDAVVAEDDEDEHEHEPAADDDRIYGGHDGQAKRVIPSSASDEILALEQQRLRGHISDEELERRTADILARYRPKS